MDDPPCSDSQTAGTVDIEMPVAGARFGCTCSKALRECAGKPAQVEICECPDFVWTQASGEARPLDDPEVIWKSEVEKFGNTRD
jgi:hypothetical protein